MRRPLATIAPIALMLAAALAPAAGLAEGRDPAYAAARAAGQVGERPNGYLAVVGAGTPGLHQLVNAINIKRKDIYAERAVAQGTTIEAYALTTGCHLIDQTEPGEKYMAPDGTWHTRDSSAPIKDPRCP